MRGKLTHTLLILTAVLVCAAVSFSSIAAEATMPSAGKAGLTVVDISQWNDSVTNDKDNIDFALLKTQVDAVYIRAYGCKDGVPYIDMQAVRYANSAQAVNLPYGFYYYYIPKADQSDARSQAQAYYSFVKTYAYSCVPALDVEENPDNLSKAELAASVKAFADEFKALSGFDLMIYSYPYFIKENFDPSFNWTAYRLWIAHYNVPAPMSGISSTWMPPELWCWERWDMWQYTSTGTLSSIPNSSGGSLDISTATDTILLSTPMFLSFLDTPNTKDTYGGDTVISGWALSHSGISRVDIYADDFRWVGSTDNLYERSDVQAVMNPGGRYNDGLHSGYSYTVDAGFFTVGQHTLRIAVISRNGSVNWTTTTIRIGPDPQMCLDTPANAAVSGDIAVKGWAVSHAGISRVDVYVDNIYLVGSVSSLSERSDINTITNASGKYKNALHSGFSYTIPAGQLSSGTHEIRVAAVSYDGSVQTITRTITVASDTLSEAAKNITYQSHIQDIGWQDWVSNGAVSGTSGQSKRLEAMHIKLNNISGSIEYRTHIQDIGWMGWVADGTLSGTSGQSKRLEAIQIRLTGTAAVQYDVYYRVHAQNTGWMDWAKNGESSGTAGYSYRLEAIQIVLVPKGGAAPGSTARPFAQA
ncbi:MAG: GH25 family lysozyme [Eubacteriales bacterium]